MLAPGHNGEYLCKKPIIRVIMAPTNRIRLNLHPQFDPIVSIIFRHITPNEGITIVIP